MADLKLDVNNVLAGRIGRHGLKEAWFKRLQPQMGDAVRAVQKARGKGMTGWFELPYEKEQVARLLAYSGKMRGRFDDVVVLGIGGSALGTIALRTALLHPYHNLLDRQQRGKLPRLHVLDNVDPINIARLFEDVLDVHRTLFIVISKSGATAETMSQFMLAYELLEGCVGEKKLRKHLVAITDREQGYLRPLADELQLESYVIEPGVGGRFSVLSPVGLLPAALCGMDVRGLLRGAAAMDKRCRTTALFRNPAALYAAVHYLADTKLEARLSVMMPYASGLKDLADWYCQLWAESLGKARGRDGQRLNVGPTPIKALGATDQHSQVQLYREGPYDKVISLLKVRRFAEKLPIPRVFPEVGGMGYLGGKTFQKLLHAEEDATAIALCDAGRMNLTVELAKLDAHHLGQLFFLFEVATALSGELYDIDAFNQPGVEGGKVATYALMGRKGYREEARRIRAQPAGQKKFIV